MKAILVIDIPDDIFIEDCIINYEVQELVMMNRVTRGTKRLRPLPTKITTATLSDQEQERTELFTSMAMLKVYADGYNACLKEIEQ